MINFPAELKKYGLNADNTVVIGSGILQCLGLRDSGDVDVVVTTEVYRRLASDPRFIHKPKRGRTVLVQDKIEIQDEWTNILGKTWYFDDLLAESVIIDGVRHNSLDFLYRVKTSWLHDDDVRPGDIRDVKLIEKYMSGKK